MHRAEQLISSIRSAYLARTLEAWRDHEREFLIELVRGLDEAAFAFTMAPNKERLLRKDENRHLILRGGTSALRPFIEKLRNDSGGVPWGPTSPALRAIADQHLINCGRLAIVQRLAALERYGLAETTFAAENRVIIEVSPDDNEVLERAAGAWLGETMRQRLSAAATRMAAMKGQVASRIDRYASVHDGWFLRYNPDDDMVAYHRDWAAIYCAGRAEADALPGTSLLGGLSFAEWNEASITACGRVLHHIACATRLKATKPSLELRNLLTVFARKEDITAVWQQAGETVERAARIIAGLSLDAETAAACERDYELPLPYYIDFGQHFVLLPSFGGLMNSVAGLTWHLRRNYRPDWDKAVGGREQIFRNDLRELFPSPRYTIPDRGVRLRRADGTELTDVDAIVLDRQTGRLALVQLKWPDIYGRSLAERESRRLNLLKANEWVGRVSEWVGGRSAREISAALGLGPSGAVAPMLLVVARHTASFEGKFEPDPRATWVSWPRLVLSCQNSQEKDVLGSLDRSGNGARRRERRRKPIVNIHELPSLAGEFPSLTVEIHLSE